MSLWGVGGGRSLGRNHRQYGEEYDGGPGGFTECTITVPPGTAALTVVVGRAGNSPSSEQGSPGWGHGDHAYGGGAHSGHCGSGTSGEGGQPDAYEAQSPGGLRLAVCTKVGSRSGRNQPCGSCSLYSPAARGSATGTGLRTEKPSV